MGSHCCVAQDWQTCLSKVFRLALTDWNLISTCMCTHICRISKDRTGVSGQIMQLFIVQLWLTTPIQKRNYAVEKTSNHHLGINKIINKLFESNTSLNILFIYFHKLNSYNYHTVPICNLKYFAIFFKRLLIHHHDAWKGKAQYCWCEIQIVIKDIHVHACRDTQACLIHVCICTSQSY